MNPDLTISETRDWKLAWKIVTDPSVFDHVCDDKWVKKPEAELQRIIQGIVENPVNHVTVVFIADEPVGLFMGYHVGNATLEVHTMLTSRCRGADAIQAGKMAMRFGLNLPGIEKLVSFCPANLPETYLFARYCGWHKAGISTTKWLKNGIEHAMRLVEATKKDLAPCL